MSGINDSARISQLNSFIAATQAYSLVPTFSGDGMAKNIVGLFILS